MRTPLNGVLGTLQLLSKTELDQRQTQYVGVMETSGKLLLEHVNNVLDISRADAGMIDIANQEFDLRDLVSEVVQGLDGQALARGNALSVDFLSANISAVLGDEARVRQILFNLLGNAIKFTQNGTVTIEAERHANSDEIEFRIIDTGIGIDDHDIDKIFDDFVTLDSSYQREVEGTGLGLGIVRRLVDVLGGEIGVESVKNEGSVFWFTLPLPDASAHAASKAPTSASKVTQHSDAKVLVVEDNEINRMIVREMLAQSGCQVHEAIDGHEGVLVAENIKFDLILMDISMPKVDGVEATQTIKGGDGPNRDTPIIALTAHALEDDVKKFHAAGMSDVITKPISADRLNQVLSEVLNAPTSAHATNDEMIELFGSEKAEALQKQAREQLETGFADLEELMSSGAKQTEIAALAHKLAGTAALFGMEDVLTALRSIEGADDGVEGVELTKFLNAARMGLREGDDN